MATLSKKVTETVKRYKDINVVKVDNENVSKGWNTLMSKASTPYVPLARDVVRFTWFTQLERQIRGISQIPNVGVAGRAYRHLTGHWKAGSVRATLKKLCFGISGRLLSL